MNTANSLPATFTGMLQKTLHCSRYARRVLETDQPLLNWLQENFTTPCNRAEIQALLRQSIPSHQPSPQPSPAGGRGGERVAYATSELNPETELACAVRKLRKRVMVKLILRDLNGLAD